MNLIRRLCKDTEAATAVEYAVMLALILLVAISAIASFGAQSGGLWGGVRSDLTGAGLGG